MARPVWNDDEPGDASRIAQNATALVAELAVQAQKRSALRSEDICSWHAALYAGCRVPLPDYLGRFRGDRSVAELIGYEVGVGQTLADGLPEGVGVWSVKVAEAVATFMRQLEAAVATLDALLAAGVAPETEAELDAIVSLISLAHGEWIRIHPFANGNGRTARVLAAFLALRYGLPVFVRLKPRPDGTAYSAAATASMGRPPDFVGDHELTRRVFANLLMLELLDPAP